MMVVFFKFRSDFVILICLKSLYGFMLVKKDFSSLLVYEPRFVISHNITLG